MTALLTRMMFPLADPPADLSWSGGYYADEGFWVHNARNEILFGNDPHDQWNNKIVSPTLHFPVKLLFTCLGVNLLTVRIWAMLLAVITLVFLSSISRRIDPSGWLFFTFAVNSFLVAYQRIAVLESAVLPAAVLTMWLWLRGLETRRSGTRYVFDILTGASAAWVWQIKMTQLYFIPLVILATWLSEPDRKRVVMTMLRQSAGAGCVILTWWRLIYISNGELLRQYNHFYLSQHGSTVTDLVKNILMQPLGIYFNRLPVIFPAALLLTGLFVVKRRFRLMVPAIVFAWLWFVMGTISLVPLGYRPLRYYLPIVIPMTLLGYRFLTHREIDTMLQKLTVPSRIFILLILMLPPAVNIAVLLDKFAFGGAMTGLTTVEGYSVPGAVFLLAWTLIWCLAVLYPARMIRRRLAVQGLVFCLVFQSVVVGYRMINRSYDILSTSTDLVKILPENAVIAGQWAPELVLDTPFRAVPVWKGFVNWETPLTQYGITHILCWNYPLGNECDHQSEWFPDTIRQAELIKTYSIKKSAVSLLRIPSSLSSTRDE